MKSLVFNNNTIYYTVDEKYSKRKGFLLFYLSGERVCVLLRGERAPLFSKWAYLACAPI